MPMPAPIVAQVGLSTRRVAVVFKGGGAWHYSARLAIHAASRLWGGRGFLLVLYVDGVVAPAMLRAARTYDPDYVVLLQATVVRLRVPSPARFRSTSMGVGSRVRSGHASSHRPLTNVSMILSVNKLVGRSPRHVRRTVAGRLTGRMRNASSCSG